MHELHVSSNHQRNFFQKGSQMVNSFLSLIWLVTQMALRCALIIPTALNIYQLKTDAGNGFGGHFR